MVAFVGTIVQPITTGTGWLGAATFSQVDFFIEVSVNFHHIDISKFGRLTYAIVPCYFRELLVDFGHEVIDVR